MYQRLFNISRHVLLGINPSEEDLLEELFDRVYTSFVEEVDAVDNGISAFDGTPRYCSSLTWSRWWKAMPLTPPKMRVCILFPINYAFQTGKLIVI